MVTVRPDGAGTRARIGLLTPHLDPVAETEARVLLPQDISLHVARFPLGLLHSGARIVTNFGIDAAMSFTAGPGLRSAATRLSGIEARAAICAFTSASYVKSPEEENETEAQLSDWLGGIDVILQARATVDALRALGAGRAALIHPPWIKPELVDLGAEYFARGGIGVADNARLDLAREFCEVDARAVFAWISARVPDDAEAIVICGNGVRGIGIIEALEAELGRPVVTSTQAAVWSTLRRCGFQDRIEGYGRLFDCEG